MKAIFEAAFGLLLIAAAAPAMATAVPIAEPGSLSLFAAGAGSIVAIRALRRRR